jgi:hypothetical protein
MLARLSRIVRCAALSAAALLAAPAWGQTSACGSPDRPRVDVSGTVAGVEGVIKLLRAELAARAIDVCPASEGPEAPSIATVSVSARPEGAFVEVEVHDSLTAKRVSRDVDLGAVPEDGKPLTLALVADELLRASWAEIALRGAPPPARPVPAAVREAVREDVSGADATGGTTARWEAIAEAEAWGGALGLYGVDVRASLASAWGLAATARLGVREGATARGPDGQVHPSAMLGGVGLSVRAVPRGSRLGMDALARIDVVHLTYDATPNAGAGGRSRSDATLLVGAGVDGWVMLGASAALLAEVLIDAPTRPVVADDAGRSVVAASGAGIEGGLGIRVAF